MENVMFCKDLLHEDVLQTEKKNNPFNSGHLI